MLCSPPPNFNLLKSKHICTKTETTRDLKAAKRLQITMSIRLKKIEIFKKPKPAPESVFSWCGSVTTERYRSERAFYTRACKDGRGAAQVAPADAGQSHGFAGLGEEPPPSPGSTSLQLQEAAPPELGVVHQKHLENLGRLGRDRGSDTAPFSVSSWSDPKPGLSLHSLVSGKMLRVWRDWRKHSTQAEWWCQQVY